MWCSPFHYTNVEHIHGEHTATIKKLIYDTNFIGTIKMPVNKEQEKNIYAYTDKRAIKVFLQ